MLFLSFFCNLWSSLAIGSEEQKSSRRTASQAATIAAAISCNLDAIQKLLCEKVCSTIIDALVCQSIDKMLVSHYCGILHIYRVHQLYLLTTVTFNIVPGGQISYGKIFVLTEGWQKCDELPKELGVDNSKNGFYRICNR